MGSIFAAVLNMSLTASAIIILVLLARLCLKKAPKIYSYILWSAVLFRLLCPFSLSLPVSVLAPASEASTSAGYVSSMEYIPVTRAERSAPPQSGAQTETQSEAAAQSADGSDTLPVPPEKDSVPRYDAVLNVLGWIWFAGAAIMLGFSLWQTIALKIRLAPARPLRGNIYETDEAETAFVIGVLSPKIYLPLGLAFDVQKAVIVHEQTHQKRGDHIIKLIAFFALSLHWFNPLVWTAYKQMVIDMEKSCDEAVIRKLYDRGYEEKSVRYGYGKMLAAFGSGKSGILAQVSFGEHSTVQRIKNVLHFVRLKKPAAIAVAAVLCVAITVSSVNPLAPYKAATLEKTLEVESSFDRAKEESLPPAAEPEYELAANIFIWTEDNGKDMLELRYNDEPVRTMEVKNKTVDLAELQLDSRIDCLDLYSDLMGNNGESDFYYEPLGDLSYLSELKNLRSLGLSLHGDDMDLSVLYSLDKLTELVINNSGRNDYFSFLKDNTQLISLSLCDNYTYDTFSIPSGMPGLESISVICGTRTGKVDYSALSDCPLLRHADIEINNSTDLSFLSDNPLLESLEVWSYDTVDLVSMGHPESLRSLKIETSMFFEKDNTAFWEKAVNLESINISSSKPDDLSFLTNLRKLKHLQMYSSSWNLPNAVYGNDYNTTDISAIANCAMLEEVYMQGIGIGDVSPLSSLNDLTFVNLSNNSIRDFSPLTGLENLVFLSLGRNNIEELPDMSGLKSLNYLILSVNPFSDITNLPTAENVFCVDLNNTGVTDISPLASMGPFCCVDLSFDSISDLSPLYDLQPYEPEHTWYYRYYHGMDGEYENEYCPGISVEGDEFSSAQVRKLREKTRDRFSVWDSSEWKAVG